MNPSGKVKFMYVEGDTLPANPDKSTMYIVSTTPKTLYIGSDPIGGSSGPDAEILDARIGVDGTVYTDLGTAIRSQISDLADGVIGALNANY